MVKTLPFADIEVNTPGFGAMGISSGMGTNLSLEEAEPVLRVESHSTQSTGCSSGVGRL
ncbi:hypothetical protein EDB81DRAFT_793973 [Dactylonectria macrodidyma]|uniref:Uncharacterized protein n=1 Tax=Dactylonectria macrodidyma TaxID=307937 RepID=A0A9P9J879_9HYPO|nr:hypothetical protein EDB81DRAFT_793973 [Dactylonectria macrodidyma]